MQEKLENKQTRLVKLVLIGQKNCKYSDSQFWNWLMDPVCKIKEECSAHKLGWIFEVCTKIYQH